MRVIARYPTIADQSSRVKDIEFAYYRRPREQTTSKFDRMWPNVIDDNWNRCARERRFHRGSLNLEISVHFAGLMRYLNNCKELPFFIHVKVSFTVPFAYVDVYVPATSVPDDVELDLYSSYFAETALPNFW